MHVPDGEDMDQGAHPGDDQGHQRGQRVPEKLEAGADSRHPFPEQDDRAVLPALEEGKRCGHGDSEGAADGGRCQPPAQGSLR